MINRHAKGLTLLESVMLMTILSVVSLGFCNALQASMRVTVAVDQKLALQTKLLSDMEDLTSNGFDKLVDPTFPSPSNPYFSSTGVSDTVSLPVNGGMQTFARNIKVAYVDVNGDGSADTDCLELSITINGQLLKTRMTHP